MRPLTSEETWIMISGVIMLAFLIAVIGTYLYFRILNIIEKYKEERRK